MNAFFKIMNIVQTKCLNRNEIERTVSWYKYHVIVKMADEREPPPFGEDENQKDDDDLFAEASEVWF